MTGRDYDLKELRPLGEASLIPDHRLEDHSDGDPAGNASRPTEQGILSNRMRVKLNVVPVEHRSQRRRRNVDTVSPNHLDDSPTESADTHPDSTLVGIVYMLVESVTFYDAVAKGAAAANMLMANESEGAVDEHRLIYDLKEEPALKLANKWPSLPNAARISSASGEELLAAVRQRMGWDDGSPTVIEQEA